VTARAAVGVAAVVGAGVWPTAALACPVCGGGGQNQQAYIDMTIFMSLTPLVMLGTVALVLWRLHRKAEESGQGVRRAGGPSSSESSAPM
jgi:hypothetical protein